jgi:sec-independent protein translocase protein TatA
MHLLAWHVPGFDEWIVIAIIGVLLFGKRLPEVGKNLGKGIVEFKKGLKGISDEVEQASSTPAVTARPAPVLPVTTVSAQGEPVEQAPVIPAGAKFDPFTGKPLEAKESESIGVA